VTTALNIIFNDDGVCDFCKNLISRHKEGKSNLSKFNVDKRNLHFYLIFSNQTKRAEVLKELESIPYHSLKICMERKSIEQLL
tara:strand:- start:2893 stop:3141 length:249 start_codon:yes stop_codon:yes gene_type:complete